MNGVHNRLIVGVIDSPEKFNFARNPGEPKCDRQLHSRIAPRDAGFAIAAARAQQKPAQQRDVVIPADGVGAMRAPRAGMNDRLVRGEARDADVEEAAEEETDKESA